MTDNSQTLRRAESRRSFIRRGVIASGAALGVPGAVAAQEGDTDDDGDDEDTDSTPRDDWIDGLVFRKAFRPEGRFAFVSGPLDRKPDADAVNDSRWADYVTFRIRWIDTGEVDLLFAAEENLDDIGEYVERFGFVPDRDDDPRQPQVWMMNDDFSPFGFDETVVSIDFRPITEDEEDDLLDDDGWWTDGA